MIQTRVTGAVLAAALCAANVASADTLISIGTGGVTGVYYPTGGAICRLVNKGRKEHGIRCSAEPTDGSIENVRMVHQGELEFGVVQSDVQSQALTGEGPFSEEGAFENLRALFSVHPEPLHLMVRADAGIASLEDLKGKKVNVGSPGSGMRSISETLMASAEMALSDFAQAADLPSAELATALCAGEVDAAIWVAGLPNGVTLEATSSCDVTLLPLEGPIMDALLDENPAFARAVIPAEMYPGNSEDVVSWGPKATVVTSADVPDEVVYTLVSAVFENFEDFKRLHPAFARLTEQDMIGESLTAPLHPGAQKYYQEREWE